MCTHVDNFKLLSAPRDCLSHSPRLQGGAFCPTSQPEWSAFREASFGFGVLEILNETHATWEWKRNAGLGGGQGGQRLRQGAAGEGGERLHTKVCQHAKFPCAVH